jgi:hypothetical protein
MAADRRPFPEHVVPVRMNGKTYVVRTFGCQMNEHDS